MFDFLFQSYNLPFSIPLAVIAILTAFEVLTLMLGISMLNLLDDFLDFEIDVDSGMSSSGIGHLICIDKVPFIIWLCIFLGCFGVTGVALNQISITNFAATLPAWISVPTAFFVGLIPARIFAKIVGKFMPKVESSAIDIDALAGAIGQITIGKATFETPAEAKVSDQHQQIHYVMVRPGRGEVLSQGEDLVLFEKGKDNVWICGKFDREPLFEDK
tara:strand:+ start:956 stop:1603 length:648 start_codon:yes stop_codon:yes gene_type:complete